MARHFLKLSGILQKLLYRERLSPAELARKTDLPTPTIHRMVTGKSTRPYRSTLQPVADFFSISVDQLIGDKPLPNEDNTSSNKDIQSKGLLEIPLYLWPELSKPQDKWDSESKIFGAPNLPQNCFAILMPDSSMEPHFEEGTTLILNPNQNITDRCFALVRLNESNTLVFRQILIDADYRYLKPLNPDLSAFQMRFLEDEDTVLGILVEARRQYITGGIK